MFYGTSLDWSIAQQQALLCSNYAPKLIVQPTEGLQLTFVLWFAYQQYLTSTKVLHDE